MGYEVVKKFVSLFYLLAGSPSMLWHVTSLSEDLVQEAQLPLFPLLSHSPPFCFSWLAFYFARVFFQSRLVSIRDLPPITTGSNAWNYPISPVTSSDF